MFRALSTGWKSSCLNQSPLRTSNQLRKAAHIASPLSNPMGSYFSNHIASPISNHIASSVSNHIESPVSNHIASPVSNHTPPPISSHLPVLNAPQAECSLQTQHIQAVSDHLSSKGILKISLGFADDESHYLEQLLLGLHKYHGHGLPITHSASRGWFWDIRPNSANFQTANCQARSETMEEFPWHTDCSYEDPPPRYFALQVLQPDRYGGGVLSLMNVQRLSELLSPSTLAALMRPEYKIKTPPEFIKQAQGQQHIIRGLLELGAGGQPNMRFRSDIVTPLSSEASQALRDLGQVISAAATQSHITMHLTAADLPARTIVLVNNRRWLHARTDVKDPERHLRRVRWDAIPFQSMS